MKNEYQKLHDAKIPLQKRMSIFDKALEKFGALDPTSLSLYMGVRPQIITAYYELTQVDENEIKTLETMKLDGGLLSVIMNLQPSHRNAVYKNIDEFIKKKYPVYEIIKFVNDGAGATTINEIYKQSPRNYWKEVSTYLKAKDIANGTITKGIRSMLINISMKDASQDQLDWLERAILHDRQKKLDAFTSKPMKNKFPDTVKLIAKFSSDQLKL